MCALTHRESEKECVNTHSIAQTMTFSRRTHFRTMSPLIIFGFFLPGGGNLIEVTMNHVIVVKICESTLILMVSDIRILSVAFPELFLHGCAMSQGGENCVNAFQCTCVTCGVSLCEVARGCRPSVLC